MLCLFLSYFTKYHKYTLIHELLLLGKLYHDLDEGSRVEMALDAERRACNPTENMAFLGVRDVHFDGKTIKIKGFSQDNFLTATGLGNVTLEFEKKYF